MCAMYAMVCNVGYFLIPNHTTFKYNLEKEYIRGFTLY